MKKRKSDSPIAPEGRISGAGEGNGRLSVDDWLPSQRRAALEALVGVYAGDDDGFALLAYQATAHHLEGPNRDLALTMWRAVGVEPRKNRRRGRPRKRRPA